jgi:5-methyltetrahydrofolate--homocysteine methyltransferase
MLIIGEKINGSVPAVAKAIAERDEVFIKNLALKQTKAGANYLDIAAGTAADKEKETLAWLINIVQSAVDTPLCLDSPDCRVLLDVMPQVLKPGIINSVSEEHGKCEIVFPVIAHTEWKIIALTCDNRGISTDPDVKLEIASVIIEKAEKYGINQNRLFIDPIAPALCTDDKACINFIDAVRKIKNKFPDIHITAGLSNISFGMPHRLALNKQFLTLGLNAGMDSPIMDPASADMRSTMYAAEALLGRDNYCRKYLTAYRKGVLGGNHD